MRALLVFALTACTQAGPDRPGGRTDRGLVVHEWGTYTSLQGSDGRSMDGLHHAEHLLPPFVFARAPSYEHQKGLAALPEPVNQKLETPVLYFYGEPRPVTVKVGFPEGIISEWFPDAIAFAPPLDDMPKMAGGSMTWKVELIDPERERLSPIEVAPNSIWAPSRRVRSLGVRYDQDERFIFYRGLGRFERPFRVTRTRWTSLLENASDDRIPAAFVLSITGDGAWISEPVPVAPRSTAAVEDPSQLIPIERYLPDAKATVERALIATGLYEDEARAMVDTWEESYFTAPGTRVLYIAPRAWTDALLPIEIEPHPVELVRTLVGRVEVMTAEEEAEIVAHVEATFRGERWIPADRYGRFTEPKLRRAMELIEDPEVKSWCQGLVDSLASLP